MEIPVRIRQLHAETVSHDVFGVCGNSGDTIRFDFDAEWDAYPDKTACMVIVSPQGRTVTEIPIQGNVCTLPPVRRTAAISVGVCAGSLHTAASASIPYRECITDILAEEFFPKADICNKLLAELMHLDMQDECSGRYLVSADENYIATQAGDYLLSKE